MARPKRTPSVPLFSATNYRWLGGSVALLAFAYGGMWVEKEFTGVFSLYVAPVLLILGYAGTAYALIKRPGGDDAVV